MINTRQNSADIRVKRLKQEATNLKTSQYTGWDSIRSYVTQTSNEFDFSITPETTAMAIHIYMRFTADHQNAPLAAPQMSIKINDSSYYRVGLGTNPDEAIDKTDYGVYTNGWVPDAYGGYSPDKEPNKINEISFYNTIQFNKIVSLKVKFRVYSLDTGRLTVRVEAGNQFKGMVIQ